jgi:hypothetical protein
MANLNQAAAERGVATGSPDSPNAGAAALRALGLTDLDLEKLGHTQLTEAIQRTPRGPEFNPASMLVDPNMQTALQWLANQLKAAPVPAAAKALELDSLGNAFANARNQASGGGGNPNMGWLNDMQRNYLPPSTVKPLDTGHAMGPGPAAGGAGTEYPMPDWEYPELYDPSMDYSMGGVSNQPSFNYNDNWWGETEDQFYGPSTPAADFGSDDEAFWGL